MAELNKYRSFILTYDSTTGTFVVGSNGFARVFKEGASASQVYNQLSNDAGTVVNVYDSGSFAVNDWAQIGLSGTARKVTAFTATSLTLDSSSGAVQTVAVADRILNIGTASDKTVPGTVIYKVDQTTGTTIDESKVTADANGNFEFFAASGDYDILIQSSGGTDLFIDGDISLGIMSSNSSSGIGGAAVVYPTSVTSDFAVGGSAATSCGIYVDTSADTLYINGTTNPNIALTGGTVAKITLDNVSAAASSTDLSLVLKNSSATALTLVTAHTQAQTITFPDLTGTILLAAGTQTVTGAKTFTGGVTITTTATSMTSALQSTSTGYFQSGLTVGTTATPSGGDLLAKRLKSDQGTTVVSAKVVPSTSTIFGTNPTVAITSNSKDQRMTFTVTIGASPTGLAGTIVVTYADLTWTTAPFVLVQLSGNTSAQTLSLGGLTWVVTDTIVTITVNMSAAPAQFTTLTFTMLTWG